MLSNSFHCFLLFYDKLYKFSDAPFFLPWEKNLANCWETQLINVAPFPEKIQAERRDVDFSYQKIQIFTFLGLLPETQNHRNLATRMIICPDGGRGVTFVWTRITNIYIPYKCSNILVFTLAYLMTISAFLSLGCLNLKHTAYVDILKRIYLHFPIAFSFISANRRVHFFIQSVEYTISILSISMWMSI